MKSLTDKLAEIRKREQAATPGPWQFNASTYTEGLIWIPEWDGRLYLRTENRQTPNIGNNTQFIAHARTDIPKLLAVIDACLEGFEGTIGEGFWQSPLAKHIEKILTEGAE
jgi:hypothetical protein